MEQQNQEHGATGDAPEAPNHSQDDAQPTEADLSARVQELEERAQRYLTNWQRAQADLSNFRRQVERDQEEMAQWASVSLMQQTLSVLDDLERAFGNVPANLLSLTWIEGVWLVYKKLEAMLVARGLEALEVEPGQTFDPNLHQAVTEADGVSGAVVDVVQRGYTVGGRLLRPALVTVGNGSVAATADTESVDDEAAEQESGGDDAESTEDAPESDTSA
jgi:molecular chaperone GrpE